MENKRIFGVKKCVVNGVHNLMLWSMLYSSFFATSQEMVTDYFNQAAPRVYKGSVLTGEEKQVEEQHQTSPVTAIPAVKPLEAENVGHPSRKEDFGYVADINHGFIGADSKNPLDDPKDNIFKFNIGELPANSKVYLSYDLYGIQDLSGVSRSINDRLATGGYVIKTEMGWSTQKEQINPEWLNTGENRVTFGIVGADCRYEIRNLKIEVEQDASPKALVVNTPQIGYSKDNKCYIKGFIANGGNNVKVFADETPMTVINGEYEGFFALTDRIKSQKFAMVKAYDEKGLLGQEIVMLDYLIEADKAYAFEKPMESKATFMASGQEGLLAIDGASLAIGPKALTNPALISVSKLRKADVLPMASGMINVTKGGYGYRFLPDGIKFEKPVSLSIGYDPNLIPAGYTTNDIKTYYFNTDSKSWVAMERDSIDKTTQSIASFTNHFTDYVNGIIQTPESPETAGHTPTMMNDIKAADPSAEMTLISPPEVSQKGDANITYPIKIPAGRGGMQPQVALQYSNEGGNGWTGQGWSLNVPALTIDTRWGIPKFVEDQETEIYLLNGEQLMYPQLQNNEGNLVDWMPNRHYDINSSDVATDVRGKIPGAIFTMRKQGGFTRIERLGDSPQNYFWKVTANDGTISWYGGKGEVQEDFVLRDANNNIVHWALLMTEDVHTNNIVYVYDKGTLDNSPVPNLEDGIYFYPKQIFYTGHQDILGDYVVEFVTPHAIKTDATINARLGIKQVDPFLLQEIVVKNGFAPQDVRKYAFKYGVGKFKKHRIAAVSEFDGNGHFFNEHLFEYYNDIPQGDNMFFSAGVEINVCDDPYTPCADSDGDTICDDVDHCPHQYGVPSNNGCPEGKCYHTYLPAVSEFFCEMTHVYVDGAELQGSPFNSFTAFLTAMQQQHPVASYSATDGILTIDNTNDNYNSLVFYCRITGKQVDFRFVDCGEPVGPRPRKGKDYQKHFRSQNDNYVTYEYDGVIPIGNPECPSFINYDFLVQGYIPSFDSSLSVLGSSLQEMESYGGYIGVGIGCSWQTKKTTLGVSWSWSKDKSKSRVAMIDINGDGLDDVVLEQEGLLFYKPHHLERTYDAENVPQLTHTFGDKKPITGINNFYRGNGSSESANVQITFGTGGLGGFLGADFSKSKSTTNVYFTDGNGDGLTDIVKNGVVYFNKLNDNGNPVFVKESIDTENMVIKAEVMELEEPIDVDPAIQVPTYDVVKVWEAPADGQIKIVNNITLTNPTQESKVSIEMRKGNCYSTDITAPYTVHNYFKYRSYLNGTFVNNAQNQYNSNVSGRCRPIAWRFKNATVDGGVQIFTPTNPNDFFIVHGNASGPSDMCPNYCPTVIGPWTYDPVTQTPNSAMAIRNWYQSNVLQSVSYYNGYASNESGLFLSSSNILHNKTGFELSFYTDEVLDYDTYFEKYDLEASNPTWEPVAAFKSTLPLSNTIGLDTFVTLNGVQMPGTYNLVDDFAVFNNAFVSQFGDLGSISIQQNPNYTLSIQIFGQAEISTITLTPVGQPNQSVTYNFTASPNCPENRISNPLANPKITCDLLPEQKEFAINQSLAKGNELNLPIHTIPVSLTIKHAGKTYVVTKKENTLVWQSESSEIVTDRNEIAVLTQLLPANFDVLYRDIQEANTQKVNEERKEAQLTAQQWVKNYFQTKTEKQAALNRINTATCVDMASELCLLFQQILNAGTSAVSNTITTANTACGGGPLNVKKGDRIYFRVHSVTGENPPVEWDPYVEYVTAGMATEKDQNDEFLYKSAYSEGFVLSRFEPLIFPGNTGTVNIEWDPFVVATPSDDVTFEIYKLETAPGQEDDLQSLGTPFYTYTCTPTGTTLQNTVTPTSVLQNIAIGDPNNPGTATQFYFKVFSTSNVKWSDCIWRPKVVCEAVLPVTGESGPEGNINMTEAKFPIVDYSIYKSYPCSPKYSLLDKSTYNGGVDLKIKPYINSPFSDSDPDGVIWFVVKCNGKLVGKRKLTVSHIFGQVQTSLNNTAGIDLDGLPSNMIEIGYYGDDSMTFDTANSLLSKLVLASGPVVKISYGGNWHDVDDAKVNYYHRANPKFGPMYRQWGQFLYSPDFVLGAVAPFEDDLINESALLYTQALVDAVETAVNDAENLGAATPPQNEAQEEQLFNTLQTFPTTYNLVYSQPLLIATPKREELAASEKWIGFHTENYASATAFRAATADETFSSIFDPEPYEFQSMLFTGAYGINKISRGKSSNLSGGGSFGFDAGFEVGGNVSKTISGSNVTVTDYTDFNGDRYPDIVTSEKVQYTNRTGGLVGAIDRSGNLVNSRGDGYGFGASGSFSKGSDKDNNPSSKGGEKDPKFQGFRGNSGGNLTGNFSASKSVTNSMWVDINGDGLADRVTREALTGINIHLNNGYFPEEGPYDWNLPGIFKSKGKNISAGVGINKWNGSVELAASLTSAWNGTEHMLIDMNGDGLLDFVNTEDDINVTLNTGHEFVPFGQQWSGEDMKRESVNVGFVPNGTVTFAWVWPLPIPPPAPPICLKIPAISVSASKYGTSVGKTKKTITDFDGDGYPDIVQQVGPNTLKVFSSTIRRTDMLRKVTNPLGGSFTIDYKVQKVDYNNPDAKWVMSSVEIDDHFDKSGDGEDIYRKAFVYENGKYDRREREFYGFETVKVVDNIYDEEGVAQEVYRTSVSKYHNDSYFLNGLLKESYICKGADEDKIYSRTVNTYQIKKLVAGNSRLDPASNLPLTYDVGGSEGRRSVAVVLSKTQTFLHELSTTPLLITESSMEYDDLGRVIKFNNFGNISDSSDDYVSLIKYHGDASLLEKNILTVPQEISVMVGPDVLRSRSTSVDVATGDIEQIRAVISTSPYVEAITDMKYDEYGNLGTIIYPENDNAQRMYYEYGYDTDLHKYVTSINDAYGYTSSAAYDSSFDKVLKTVDKAGNTIEYGYDNFGRTMYILAPKEKDAGIRYTIAFEYYPYHGNLPPGTNISQNQFVPVAKTRHYDMQHPDNDIETYTFMDGMARPIQMKKDIMLPREEGSNELEEAMSVSGRATYDAFGRTVKQFHPIFEGKDMPTNFRFNDNMDQYASSVRYDRLDRTEATIDPAGAVTEISYSLAEDIDHVMALKTRTVSDQNGSQEVITETYTDISGKTISVMNLAPSNQQLWTKFDYNAIGELKSYTDADELTTTYTYDMLGRKTAVVHPDNGETRFEYDDASNMIRLQTAKLIASGEFIDYKYYFNRVTEVKFPGNPNISDVAYKYGDTGYETGRVIQQDDATGVQYFQYGNMGEMTYNRRIVVGPSIPTRAFETNYQYDSFNRLQQLVYPDGERVHYQYDLGGNLTGMIGTVNGSEYGYLRQIQYDHFEQYKKIMYGNGTKTEFTYLPATRRVERMKAFESNQQELFNNKYGYDLVGNVTSINNSAGVTASNHMGGTFGQSFAYDCLNRLRGSGGSFNGGESGIESFDYQASFELRLDYNKTHGILLKEQYHNKNNNLVPANTYRNVYEYTTGTHKLQRVKDDLTGAVEHFEYDANGNMVYRNGIGMGPTRTQYWDEANRLRVVEEDTKMQHYIYDANGERILKANSDYEAIEGNGTLINSIISLNGYTSYPSAFIAVSSDGIYSKHYFAGAKRIVSRIGEMNPSIFDLFTEEPRFSPDKKKQLQIADLRKILEKSKFKDFKFKEYKPYTYEEVKQILEEENKDDGLQQPQSRAANPLPIYYYHPDHLGTTTFLTDANGNSYQFFLNLPFGETMAEQLPQTYYRTPYKFNGKELDEETNMYYYGARYYDPRTSIWISVDPLFNHAPNQNPYNYCSQNPVNRTDPTGMCDDPNCTHGVIRRGWDYIGRLFGAWGKADKPRLIVGPIESPEIQKAGALPLPEPTSFPWEVIKGGASEVGTGTAVGMSLGAGLALFAVGILAAGDTGPKEDENNGIYLYRNMRRGLGGFAYFPELGASANSLGLRPQDVDFKSPTDILSPTFNNGLSTTIGDKHKPFSLVPNATKNTTLYQLDVRALGGFGLKYTPQGGTYGRITPARSMTVEEFNNQIQKTEGLWKPK